jgi:hypothetical protein
MMRNLTALLCLAFLSAAALSPLKADTLVYGGGTETGSRFNPGPGVITYMNCFTTVSGGDSFLEVTNAVFGIRRLAATGALTDVGVNLYAAEMTFDGTDFGRGTNHLIYSTNSLGPGSSTVTQLVDTGAITGVNLALELVSNPGFGGWWMGVEFTGPNAANTNNGWRVVNAPTTGVSYNAFGLFNNANSGIFEAFFAFGNPPGSSPSRFMVDVKGNLSAVPEPGSLGLLAVAATGLVVARRRK